MPWRQEWSRENPRIDEEHRRLYRLMGHLEHAIVEDSRPDRTAKAIGLLCDRMAAHFDVEETVAAQADTESCTILRDDHTNLLWILDRLRAVPASDKGHRVETLREFMGALSRHDNDVDVPLFRMMAQH